MNRSPYRVVLHLLFIAAALAMVASEPERDIRANSNVRATHGPGLSLRLTDETGPAGSIVQLKVELTEPKPISTGGGKIRTRGLARLVGVVLMNEGQDTYGVALVNGPDLTFNVISPSGLFGTPTDYPILGIAGTIEYASSGQSFPMILDPTGLTFRDASGAVYLTEIQNGRLTVGDGVTIGNVSPGSAVVPAGGVVRITGTNFTPNTRIQLNETAIREQRFINSGRIDVVLGQSRRMHGLRIRARNDENGGRSEYEYYSYERTTPIGSSNDTLLSTAVPLFSTMTYMSATVELPLSSSLRRRRSAGPAYGSAPSTKKLAFAVQNLDASNASVSVELLDRSGNPYAINTMSVGPGRYLVREIEEVFGIVAPPAAVRLRSSVPIQVLGLVADHSSGSVVALPPG